LVAFKQIIIISFKGQKMLVTCIKFKYYQSDYGYHLLDEFDYEKRHTMTRHHGED